MEDITWGERGEGRQGTKTWWGWGWERRRHKMLPKLKKNPKSYFIFISYMEELQSEVVWVGLTIKWSRTDSYELPQLYP